MLWDTRKAAYDSLAQYTPALRAKHHVMKLASGKWTVTLGPPGDVVDALGRTLRAVHVKGREWKQVPPTTRSVDREWWQDTPSHHHATKKSPAKKSPAQLDREIAEFLAPRLQRNLAELSTIALTTELRNALTMQRLRPNEQRQRYIEKLENALRDREARFGE